MRATFMSVLNPMLSVSLIAISSLSYAEVRQFELLIKEGRFEPTKLEVPSGEKFELVVKNVSSIAEEFESFPLQREKVVPPGKSVTIKIGPLKPGSYAFFGDFHPDTAQGKIEAVPPSPTPSVK